MQPGDLDDLLGMLHQDKTTRLRDQLTRVRRELNTRRLVSAEHTINLFDQITELTAVILRLLPEHPNAGDPHRVIREGLERERRLLEKEITEEVRNRWRDVQDLRREERTLLDTLAEEVRRYERNVRDYAT
jgi:hypothetical protein